MAGKTATKKTAKTAGATLTGGPDPTTEVLNAGKGNLLSPPQTKTASDDGGMGPPKSASSPSPLQHPKTTNDPVDDHVRDGDPGKQVQVDSLNLASPGDSKAAASIRSIPRTSAADPKPKSKKKSKKTRQSKQADGASDSDDLTTSLNLEDIQVRPLVLAIFDGWKQEGSPLAAPDPLANIIATKADVVVAKRIGKMENADEAILFAAIMWWLIPRGIAWYRSAFAKPMRGPSRDALERRPQDPRPDPDPNDAVPDYRILLEKGYAGT